MTLNGNRVAQTAVVLALSTCFGIVVLAQPRPSSDESQQQQGGQAGQTGQGRTGGAAGGQQTGQPRDAQTTQPPATGVISGVVTVEGGGTPVRRARITLSAPELRGGRQAITNDTGQFSFVALPAGRYTITVSKPGYVDITYGAKRSGRPGTPIQLPAGGKMEKANVLLPKGGIITGVVVDDNGEPSPGTQVRVMRYVMRTGEKTLQQAGTDQTDDRGVYRVYGLQPGDYLVSAVPRNNNIGDIRQTVMAEVEALIQQAQAGALGALAGARGGAGGFGGGAGAAGGGGGRAGRGGAGGIDVQQLMGGRGGNQDLLARAQQLQAQLADQEQGQNTAYAPVYYPGTPTPSQASPVTLVVAEERSGVDFRLMLVPTAKIEGTVTSNDGVMPQGTQISLLPLDQVGAPPVPGVNTNQTRVNQDGKFTFTNISPGQYRVMARGAVRAPEAAAAAATAQGRAAQGGRGGQGGPGGRGGPGQVTQVLWGSADVSVNGQDVAGVNVTLQQGMTITGRIVFDSMSALPPSDLSVVRVNLSPRGAQQGGDFGGPPQAVVDATGRFTIKGVLPGKYSLGANVPGGGGRQGQGGGGGGGGGRGGAVGGAVTTGGAAISATNTNVSWVLKSAVANGRDSLDFGVVVEPNQDVNATITFGDKTQEVTGTIQDTAGQPTADYTIILFASDKNFWVPQARRIQSSRPGTDGKFAFRNIPAGDYRLAAVTDVEPGEWYDPAFLEQLMTASMPVIVRDGEKKVQDMKVQGGG